MIRKLYEQIAANSTFPRVTVGTCEAEDTCIGDDSDKKARESSAKANNSRLPAGTVTTVTTVTPPVLSPAESSKKSLKAGGSDAKKESDAVSTVPCEAFVCCLHCYLHLAISFTV